MIEIHDRPSNRFITVQTDTIPDYSPSGGTGKKDDSAKASKKRAGTA
jgi:hypothetical protein